MSPPRTAQPSVADCARHGALIEELDSAQHRLADELAALRTGLGGQLVSLSDRVTEVRDAVIRLEERTAPAPRGTSAAPYAAGGIAAVVLAVLGALAAQGQPVSVTLGAPRAAMSGGP